MIKILNFILFFNFTILYWFSHISTWIRHRYTHVPHPEPSSLLPPCTIPLGHPSAPAPSIQYHASNLDWQLVSLWYYTCFNAILPNHPTLSLSHRVQKTVLYILSQFFHLPLSPASRGSLIPLCFLPLWGGEKAKQCFPKLKDKFTDLKL